METIEQLKTDNTKLTERLNNAAKFFREQKAQIEALTKENEELKRTPKEEVIDTEKWNALVTEKEDLNKQLNEYELKLQDSETAYEQLHKKYEERKKQVAELMGSQAANVETIKKEYESKIILLEEKIQQNEDLQKQLNEYELKLQDSETAYEQLHKKYDEVAKETGQLKDNIKSLVSETTNMADEYTKVTLSLENYKNENTTLKNDIKTLNEDIIKQNQEIEKIKIEKSDLEININDLTNRLSESVNGKTKYEEFTNMIIDLVDSFNNNGNNIDTDKHSLITVNTYKNSTGSQFMSDAPGMNI